VKIYLHLWWYLVEFFPEWIMFQTKFVEYVKTYISFSITFFFWKWCLLWDHVEEYSRAGQATDNNMAHVLCMLDNLGCRSTCRISNIYCFSTATVVTRTQLSVNISTYTACIVSFAKHFDLMWCSYSYLLKQITGDSFPT